MLTQAVVLSLIAGLAIPIGALLSYSRILNLYWLKEEVRHTITAIGGGALVAAISFILIPLGAEKQAPLTALLTFFLGGCFFMMLDVILVKVGGEFSQLIAMLLDFIPEAIILGVLVTQKLSDAVFVAIVIFSQNLPEGFSAFTETANVKNHKKILLLYFIIAFLGPLFSLIGLAVFVENTKILGMIMTFCAGGILYIIFEDIAPKTVMKQHWLPPLGTVLGFMIGFAGNLYLGH